MGVTTMSIPFALKDQFKKRFPSARWIQERRQWKLTCDEYVVARSWLQKKQSKH